VTVQRANTMERKIRMPLIRSKFAAFMAFVILLMLPNALSGCLAAENTPSSQNTTASGVVSSTAPSEKLAWNPLDYVELGEYEGIEIRNDGLSMIVGDMFVDVPYRDETSVTEWTLKYYYSQVNPEEDKVNWAIPEDEAVAKLAIDGVNSFRDLKDYVGQKLNENDEIITFMYIGDALMEQIAAKSTYKQIPEEVIFACEDIFTVYLEDMLARFHKIGETPDLQRDENSAHKVLAAMAIAQEAGICADRFDYEEVLKAFVSKSIVE